MKSGVAYGLLRPPLGILVRTINIGGLLYSTSEWYKRKLDIFPENYRPIFPLLARV